MYNQRIYFSSHPGSVNKCANNKVTSQIQRERNEVKNQESQVQH